MKDPRNKSAHGLAHHRLECECDVCYPPAAETSAPQPDDDTECERCGSSYHLRNDCEDTGVCDLCAQQAYADMKAAETSVPARSDVKSSTAAESPNRRSSVGDGGAELEKLLKLLEDGFRLDFVDEIIFEIRRHVAELQQRVDAVDLFVGSHVGSVPAFLRHIGKNALAELSEYTLQQLTKKDEYVGRLKEKAWAVVQNPLDGERHTELATILQEPTP